MVRLMSRWDRQRSQLRLQRRGGRRKLVRLILIGLAMIAILPPLYFHFSLRQIQFRKCGWMQSPPLVCAHGGDSTKAFPNTIALRLMFLVLPMEYCLLFMTVRDLQRISGNSTSRVGYFSMKEIVDLGSSHQHPLGHDVNIPTIEEALKLVSGSVRQVILDAKVGPPLYERGLAKDILSMEDVDFVRLIQGMLVHVERTKCKNCLVWAKSDSLARDLIKLASDTVVGYIVMIDPSTGNRMRLLRMRDAGVVGVYHPLIDEELVKVLHRRKKKVYAWTVDEEEWMGKMLLEGVDGVVTSNPSLLHRVMQDARTQCFQQGFSVNSS